MIHGDLNPISAGRPESLDRMLMLLATCAICGLSIPAVRSAPWVLAGIAVLAMLCLEGWRHLRTLDAERRAVQGLAVRAHTMTQGSLLRVVGARDGMRGLR